MAYYFEGCFYDKRTKRRHKGTATKTFSYDVSDNLCDRIDIEDVKKSSSAHLDTHPSSEPGKTTFVIRGTRGQIREALRLITIYTGEKETCVKEVQNYWLDWVNEAFPDLESHTYFLPPVFIRRVPVTKKTVAGQSVFVLGKVDAQTSCKKKRLKTSSTAVSQSSSTPSVQSSDVADDEAFQRVMFSLKKLSKEQQEVFMCLSQFPFGLYLGEPSYTPAVAHLPSPTNLPSELPWKWRQGDFDVLLIHRQYGFVVFEVKAVTNNSEASLEKRIEQVTKKLREAVEQLNKAEAMLSHLTSDIAHNVRITKTIACPNLTSQELRELISQDEQLLQQMALFHVVEFLEEAQEGLKGPVAVIPDSWLLPFTDSSSNRFCNWPPKSVKADANFIIKAKKPDSSWHLHQIRLHKSLSNYQAANQICERLKEMSEVESDDTNTPTQRKRPRITPVRFQDAQVTESEGETESEADESRSNDHLVMQEVQPQLPYCLPPVVVSHTMSPTSSYGKSTISPLPSCFPSPGFRPASTVNYNLLGAKLEKMERMLHQVIALIEELKDNSKDMKRRLVRLEHGKEVKRGKLPEGFEFPLKSPDDVERLEFDLKTDGEKRTHLECHLAMLGGTALKHVVKSILSVLFSTELARNYNFNGLKGKRGLKNHPYILQTIQDAARKSFPQATDHDLRVEISTWLAGARDRENGRRERAEFSLYKTLNCCLVEEVVEDK